MSKEIQLYFTSGVNEYLMQKVPALYFMLPQVLKSLWLKNGKIDMIVIEKIDDTTVNFRCAGYKEDGILDEKTIIHNIKINVPLKKMWFKVDDYIDYFVGTILFPEEW